jgi:DNA-binding beta-propeller fold protein YncE
VFDRTANGTLRQKPGVAGCVSERGAGVCTDGTALDDPTSVTVSPDGQNAYVTSASSGAVAVFDRASPGAPVVGRSELVRPVRGVVLVRRRGSRRFVRLRRGQLLPDGSEIDTRRGTARVTVASDQPGGRSTAIVSEGRAIIDQNSAARPTTTFRLSEPLVCPRRLATAATARKRKKGPIFIRTKDPRFRTEGDHAAGTATGTAWRTTDTCATTTIKVTDGTVRVRDFRRRRTVNVTAPDSYTARRR